MNFLLVTSLLFFASPVLALENAKVLPKGVRQVNIKTVHVDLARKYDNDGELVSLARPLSKDITFNEVLKGKQGLDNTKLRAFLSENAITHDQVLGSLSADLKGRMRVIAPIVAWGITERVTLAAAVPFHTARTEVAVGYRAEQRNAQNFLNLLSSPEYNQVAAARDAHERLSDGVAALNTKLDDNDYQRLGAWEDKALGDITLAVKTSIIDGSDGMVRLANLAGVVVPTGKLDSPDILTDVAFGGGSWDIFAGLSCDQQLGGGLFLNQFAKFTYRMETARQLRLKTADEALEVAKENVTFNPGNKIDLGASVQWESETGLELGLGYEFNRKQRDVYQAVAEVKQELEKDTATQANNLEVKLGFSSIPAFKRKQIAVPFTVAFQYKRVIDGALLVANRNVPATQLFVFDVNLYF